MAGHKSVKRIQLMSRPSTPSRGWQKEGIWIPGKRPGTTKLENAFYRAAAIRGRWIG
jgi:hypothetical protein